MTHNIEYVTREVMNDGLINNGVPVETKGELSLLSDREAAKQTIDFEQTMATIAEKHGDTYGPTQDDAAVWISLLDHEATLTRELNRAPWVVGDDPRLFEIVRRAIKRIPDRDVQLFTLRHCMFHGLSPEAAGMAFPVVRRWNICIPDITLFLFDESAVELIVAHEVAHGVTAYLHYQGHPEHVVEAAADALIDRWGFGPKPTLNDRSLSAAVARWEHAQGRAVVQEWEI